MNYDELEKLVEQQITEISKDPVKAAENAITWYFKELGGSEGDTDYQEARKFASDFNTLMQRAPNSDRIDFNNAWNNLVDANKLWYHKEDGKGIYTFASNQKEIKNLQKELAPKNIDLEKPSKDTPEKIAPKPSVSGGKCKTVPPPKPAMRFEWCVIEAARMEVGAPPGDGDPAYACARSDEWRDMNHGGSTIGELADTSIALCVESGFFSKANFAGATMEKVGKQSPAWGGPAIQPKTDVRFGDRNISIKLSGDIQAASAEAANTAPQLQFILDEWLNENATASVEDAALKAAQAETTKLFAEVKSEMLKRGQQQLITHGRAAKMISDIEKEKLKGDKADLKKIEKYEAALEALEEQGIINEVGEVVIKDFDYDHWQEKFGNEIRRKLKEIFTQVVKKTEEGASAATSLRNVLVDEILSGRRIFADAPAAIAQYIVSPDHVFSLMPEDGSAYEKTIATFAKIIKVDVRSKGGRAISKDGRLVGIGCKPAYRFDIRGKDIEGAFKEVEAEMAKKKLPKKKPLVEGEDVPGLDEFGKKIDNIIDNLEQKLTQQMVNSLNVEETVQSMTGDQPEAQNEHLTNNELSYKMLYEMVENLMSKK